MFFFRIFYRFIVRTDLSFPSMASFCDLKTKSGAKKKKLLTELPSEKYPHCLQKLHFPTRENPTGLPGTLFEEMKNSAFYYKFL